MIGPLKTLFDLQRRRAEEDADLVGRLDPARTVLLEDLIADVQRPDRLAPLGAPWLETARFTAHVASACAWLEGIRIADPEKGWAGVPLYFFQAAPAAEDEAAHRALLALEREEPPVLRRYTERYGRLPLAAQYLPTHTRVSTMLEGRYGDGNLFLRPLFSTFSTYGDGYVLDGDRAAHAIKGRVIGYRVPDFANLLDVSQPIATDFLARVVVHDLCHAYLPSTPNAAEGFHNVAALHAMEVSLRAPYRNPWEEFIHAECTDPSFCLRAEDEIREVRKGFLKIPPLAEDILDGYRKWYVHPNAVRKRRDVWGLPDKASHGELEEKIEEARADGFRLYVRLMD